jgi:hypothetical protein
MRRIATVAIALALAAGNAAAQDSPADLMHRLFRPSLDAFASVFRPVTKPAPKTPAETDLLDVPMPHLRPADDPPVPLLSYAPVEPPRAPAPRSTCGAVLARLGVEATTLAPITEGECGIATPVAVASLGNGTIDFSTRAIIGCDLAETLATWLSATVQPEARAILAGRVDGIRVAASYACRTRDSIPGAKISEHAFGRAIDISAFRVDGRWIDVKSGWGSGGPEADFLAAARRSACGPFKTVLGPGADRYHRDHFHLDLEPRRNGGTYCE